MRETRSKDGTTIAFDRLGEGPVVILVGGAFSYRRFKKMVQLAELLAERLTVINYDRRGRGDSGEAGPFEPEREIDDIDALIDAAGGSASLWGLSSGGALALRAAARLPRVERVSVYEPPFVVDRTRHVPPADFAAKLGELTAAGRRGEAVRYYMRRGMGLPAPMVAVLRLTPLWSKLKATALSLPYDWAAMGDNMAGEPLSAEEWAGVKVPTLVVAGEKSEELLRKGAKAIAEVLPNAELRTLEGQSHNVSMKALAPVLIEFFAGSKREDAASAEPSLSNHDR